MTGSVRYGRGGGFVDEAAGAETVEREGRRERVGLATSDRMREHMARARRRLETAGAPAAIDGETGNRRQADDRRAVGRHVDDAAPVAQHPHPPHRWKQLADRLERMV